MLKNGFFSVEKAESVLACEGESYERMEWAFMVILVAVLGSIGRGALRAVQFCR